MNVKNYTPHAPHIHAGDEVITLTEVGGTEPKRMTIPVDRDTWEIIATGAKQSHRSAAGQIRYLIAAGIAADRWVQGTAEHAEQTEQRGEQGMSPLETTDRDLDIEECHLPTQRPCRYCRDGRVIIDQGYGYRCQDCDGTGWIDEAPEE